MFFVKLKTLTKCNSTELTSEEKAFHTSVKNFLKGKKKKGYKKKGKKMCTGPKVNSKAS